MIARFRQHDREEARAGGHRSQAPAGQPAAPSQARLIIRLVDWRAARKAQHSCCCPAKPVIIAIIPPTPSRGSPADLLLCAHHYRRSRTALVAAGAVLMDINGVPFQAGALPDLWAA